MEFDERRYRPLSTVDLFDEAFDLYKRNFVLFLTIVATVVIPVAFLTDIYALKWANAVIAQLSSLQASSMDPTIALNDLTEFLKEGAISLAFYIPVWTLQFVTLTIAVSARYLGRPMTVGQAYIEAVGRFASGLVSTALFVFVSLLGVLFLGLAALDPDLAPIFVSIGMFFEFFIAVVVTARYPLFMGAVVAEKLGPINALNRSADLTKRETGRLVWALMCLAVISIIIYSALQGIIVLFTGGIVNSEYLTVPALTQNRFVASQVAGDLATLLLTPFEIIVITILYFDLRIRKEGFDMELLADRLGYRSVSLPEAAYAPARTAVKRGKK